jgi:hypothetical protein
MFFSTYHEYIVMVTTFFSMCVINWIKCMGGWMPCCHKGYIYIYIKKSNKETKKMKKKKVDLVCGQYTICKWVTLLKP